MKPKLPANKAEKFDQELYLKQQDHKDTEKRKRVASLYKDHSLPKSRKPSPKKKSV
jgi:hypothetical protein